jgi:putative copper resistance protein D
LLAAAFLAVLAGLVIGGGAAVDPLSSANALVRYGIPVSKMLVNLAEAGTIGALALVIFALSSTEREFGRALDLAAASAAVWTVAGAITAFLVFLDVTETPLSIGSEFSARLAFFFGEIDLGVAWFQTILIAAIVTVLCFAVRNHTALFFVTLLAFWGLVPLALQGHAAGAAGHTDAIVGIGLHTAGAAVWLGGLLTLAIIGPVLGPRVLAVVERYSTLALIAAIVVLLSGYVSAQLRLGTIENLFSTPYGLLVIVKVLALGALAAFGVAQRRWFLRGMKADPAEDSRPTRRFWLLILAEFAFMGIAIGTASALARTSTPISDLPAIDPTPAEVLTGEPLPAPVSIMNYLTSWNFDLLWVLVCAFAAFFYLAGVIRLRRRGDTWSPLRTASWLSGVAVLFWVTNGGVNVYEQYLFSAHMLSHMVLTMAIPVLLVPGAPITLALRAIVARHDGSRGGREWLLLLVHSRVMGVLTNPIVAAVLFASSLWVFYFTELFRWATEDHIGHTWMIVHFSITGYLFVQALIGIDPVPYRAPYPLRLLLLLATMAFHAFFGLALMTGTGLLLADWYGAMGRPWLPDALADQQAGGGIAWSIGEIPTVALAIIVAVQWSRSDARESKRLDRKAERTNDAELNDYNAMLAGLAERDKRGGGEQ